MAHTEKQTTALRWISLSFFPQLAG